MCYTRSGRRTQEDFKPSWHAAAARPFHRFCTHRVDKTARTQCFLSTSSSASHFLVRNGRFRLIISPAKNVVSVGYSCGTEEVKETGELMSEWQCKVARVKRWLKARWAFRAAARARVRRRYYSKPDFNFWAQTGAPPYSVSAKPTCSYSSFIPPWRSLKFTFSLRLTSCALHNITTVQLTHLGLSKCSLSRFLSHFQGSCQAVCTL